ncbi:MAG: TlpA family protein disulfide reductase [Kineosporiaceae bacterium]
MRRSRAPAAGALAMLAGLAVAVAGCTSDAGTPELRDAGDAGFVAGDGSVAVLPAADRDAPVEIAGETLDGEPLDLAGLRGGAVVLNVWGSWCAPCRAEAPDLVSAHDRLTADHPGEVAFVGLNIRDASAVNARRFEEGFGVPYPSLYDPDSLLLLQLRGEIPPNAIPSTLVLDRSGAVAARVLGRVDEATLVGLVEDVLAESPGEPSPGEPSP